MNTLNIKARVGLLLLLLSGSLAVSLYAQTNYYISPTGSDITGDGSASNPWQTLAHAVAQVNPLSGNRTINMAAGTYAISSTLNLNPGVSIVGAGVNSSIIQVNIPDGTGISARSISATDSATAGNHTFRDFTIRSDIAAPFTHTTVQHSSTYEYVEHHRPTADYGIYVQKRSNITIENVKVENFKRTGIRVQGHNVSDDEPLHNNWYVQNLAINNVTFHNAGRTRYDIADRTGALELTVVKGATVTNLTFSEAPSPFSGGGIASWENGGWVNNSTFDNIVFDNTTKTHRAPLVYTKVSGPGPPTYSDPGYWGPALFNLTLRNGSNETDVTNVSGNAGFSFIGGEKLTGQYSIRVENNNMTGGGFAMGIEANANDAIYRNNTITNFSNALQFTMTGETTGPTLLQNILVEDNTFQGNVWLAARTGTADLTVQNVIVRDNTIDGRVHVRTTGGSTLQDILIENNVIEDAYFSVVSDLSNTNSDILFSNNIYRDYTIFSAVEVGTTADGIEFAVNNISGGPTPGTGTFRTRQGSLLTGTGTVSHAAELFGTVSPGTSSGNDIGELNFASNLSLANDGIYLWQINNVNGTAGVNWDLLDVAGNLNITATASNPFVIRPDDVGSTGFDSGLYYRWAMVDAASITGFAANKFSIDTVNWAPALNGGSFSVEWDSTNTTLDLVFTPSATPTYIWDGGANTNAWGTAVNWVGDVAPNGHVVGFDANNANSQYNIDLQTNRTVLGVNFLAASSSNSFTLNNNTLTVGLHGIVNNDDTAHTINSNVSLSMNQTWNAAAGDLIFNGTVSTGTNTLTLDGAHNFTLNGVVSGSTGLTKNGTGTATLNGNNTFTGTVTVNNGTLSLGGTQAATTYQINGGTLDLNASNLMPSNSNVTIASGGTFALDGFAQTLNQITGPGQINLGSGGTLTLNHTANYTYNGTITGGTANTNALIKQGTGSLTLNQANTYSGITRVQDGRLYVAHNDALGATGAANRTIVEGVHGGAFGSLRTNTNVTLDEDITLAWNNSASSSTTGGASMFVIESGTATFNGTITVDRVGTGTGMNDFRAILFSNATANFSDITGAATGANGTNRFNIETQSGATANMNGVISNGTVNELRMTYSGPGTKNIYGMNTYTGQTVISNGTVNYFTDVANATAGAFGNNNNNVIMGDGGTPSGSTISLLSGGAHTFSKNIDLNNTNPNVTSVVGGTGAHTTTYSGNINMNSDNNQLRLHADAGGTVIISGNITDGAGTRPVTKSGAGVVELNRAAGNTYDGATTVLAGTLLANNTSGSATGTGNVTVNSGATLGGTGIISGAVTINGSLDPGLVSGTGNITINNNVTFTNGSNFVVNLNGTTPATQYDRLTIGGASSVLSLSGTNNLELNLSFTPTLGDIFFIVNNTSGNPISGIFEELNGVPTALAHNDIFTLGGHQFRISYFANPLLNSMSGGHSIALEYIPEPSLALWLALVLGTLWAVRRRKQNVAATAQNS